MEVTKENIGQAIAALRQCAKEHKNDKTDTGGIILTSLCNDIADYLEKIKNLSFIEMPSKEDITEKIFNTAGEIVGRDREITVSDCTKTAKAVVEWLKDKIVK